jgi:hypothetical protein
MSYFSELDTNLEEEATKQSLGPGYYFRNVVKTEGEPVFPWAPTTRIQKIGGSLLADKDIVDVDSELMGLNRKNSKDPNTHYKPDENQIIKYINLEDGFFHQESTLLNNPPQLLRGQVKNRFHSVFKNPQDNTIEPFKRLGENTYLNLMDDNSECPTNSIE